jgi:hypothetical protein
VFTRGSRARDRRQHLGSNGGSIGPADEYLPLFIGREVMPLVCCHVVVVVVVDDVVFYDVLIARLQKKESEKRS